MKSKFRTLICLLLAFVITFAFAACGENILYTVSVSGGTGGGEYFSGSDCTVTASLQSGKKFVKWTVDGEEVSTSNPYTFEVRGNTSLTAVVEDLAVYEVSVTGGTITGTENNTASVYEGQSVSVEAHSSQQRPFIKWLVNGTLEQTDNPYVFTPSEDSTAVAVFDEICLVSVNGGTVNDKRSDKIRAGEECTIVAAEDEGDAVFTYWYYKNENDEEVKASEDKTYTFTVTESVKFHAKYAILLTVTVEGGYAGDNTEDSVIKAVEGDLCTVKPIIPEDKGFVEWQVNGTRVSANQQYTFTVARNVTVKAIFGDLVYLFDTPDNNTNQMFSYNANYVLELDRMKNPGGSSKTAFTDHVEHVMFYVYTSASADKEDFVARFIFDLKGGPRLATLDGETVQTLEMTNPGNVWAETALGNSPAERKENFFIALERLIGEDFTREGRYYLAAQICGLPGSIYAPSGISDIGPQAFGPYQ